MTGYVVTGPRRLKDIDGNDRERGDTIEPHPDYVDMLLKAGHIGAPGSDDSLEKGDG